MGVFGAFRPKFRHFVAADCCFGRTGIFLALGVESARLRGAPGFQTGVRGEIGCRSSPNPKHRASTSLMQAGGTAAEAPSAQRTLRPPPKKNFLAICRLFRAFRHTGTIQPGKCGFVLFPWSLGPLLPCSLGPAFRQSAANQSQSVTNCEGRKPVKTGEIPESKTASRSFLRISRLNVCIFYRLRRNSTGKHLKAKGLRTREKKGGGRGSGNG
jgi:hypothetical protein